MTIDFKKPLAKSAKNRNAMKIAGEYNSKVNRQGFEWVFK